MSGSGGLRRPPLKLPGRPVVKTLPSGTLLRRVHGAHAADAFNATPQPSNLAGGRFDSLDGSFAYTYLGADSEGAIAEGLCRDLPLSGAARVVPRVRVTGRRITSVETVRPLRILSLHGAALAHVGADIWLTKCDADQYAATRAWAARLLELLPTVHGFSYRCRHDEDRIAYALFDDQATGRGRAQGALAARPDSVPLDMGDGLAAVERVLAAHNAVLEPW